MELKQLQERYKSLLTQSEAIRLKYDGKAADMNATELTEWTKILEDVDATKSMIDNLAREQKARDWANQVQDNLIVPAMKQTLTDPSQELAVKAFNRFLMGGKLDDADLAAISKSVSVKAYQADNPAGGGYLVMPQVLASTVLTLMKDLTFIRGLATVYSVPNAESLGVPAIDTDPSDSDWTNELGVGNEETTLALGKRELKPNPVAKLLKLSKKLLRQVPGADAVILDRLAYKMAITQEKGFLTGTGANAPLGVFTASTQGISTNRDVTAANASSIVADDLIKVVYKLKAQYRAKASWILHRDVVSTVRRLKDSNNNYIWSTALGPGTGFQGQASTLLGLPLMESEYAPNTITTGLYTAILGNFNFYWIVDALDMNVQVLDQLYAATNQMGYILRMESDGMPVLEEAFARLIQA